MVRTVLYAYSRGRQQNMKSYIKRKRFGVITYEDTM